MKFLHRTRGRIAYYFCMLVAPDFHIISPSVNPFVKLSMEDESKQAADILAAKQLVSSCIDKNSTSVEVEFEGYTKENKPCGDWLLTVKRIDIDNS